MKIVFLGTPEFAVPSLKKLANTEDVSVDLVISQPDRRRSRNKMLPTPVKACALDLGIEVITPQTINSTDVIEKLQAIGPDLLVVVAYGQIIGKRILSAFCDRIINLHASLLPKYRGAAPIHYSLCNGDSVTGNTIMLIERTMDTGDMLAKRQLVIEENDDLGSLTHRLAISGSELLLHAVRNFHELYQKREKQNPKEASYTRPIRKEDGYLDFNDSCQDLINRVRAFHEAPGAKFRVNDTVYRVHKAHCEEGKGGMIGEILAVSDGGIAISAKDARFVIDEIQAPNRKAMPVGVFLRGNDFPEGTKAEYCG